MKITFKPPFDKYNTDTDLTIDGNRSLSELIDSGKDPFKLIYQPVNLNSEAFTKDLTNNVKIIILKDSNSNYLYIPETYIENKITLDGVVYSGRGIVIDVGPLPVTEDIYSLLNDLQILVEARLGIKPAVEAVCNTVETYIDTDKHNEFTTARDLKKKDDGNYYIALQKCLECCKEKDQIISNLECIIKKKVPM